MNAIEFCAKHYARSVLPEFTGSDLEVVANVFESALPYQKIDPKTGQMKTVAITHADKFGYLIVSQAGYWARNAHRGSAQQAGNQNQLLPKHAALYTRFDNVEKTALFDLTRNWDGLPFLVIEMSAKQFDFSRWQLTYDLRHTVINTPSCNIVLDTTFLTNLTKEAA